VTENIEPNYQLITEATESADERRTYRSLKTQAVGRLAGGITHDFNNMLTTILGNAELLQMGGFPQAECDDMLAQILAAAKRATRMTRQLLNFDRHAAFEIASIDVSPVVVETAELLSHGVSKRIDVKPDLRADPSMVHADPAQIKIALVNLALNACDAMPDGGVLSLKTRNVVDDDERLVEICVCGVASGTNGDAVNDVCDPCQDAASGSPAIIYGCVEDLCESIDAHDGNRTVYRLLLPTG